MELKTRKFFEEMKRLEKVYDEAMSYDLNVSITWQKMTDWSIEIYKGYGDKSYENFFYTDGNITRDEAVNEALEFLDKDPFEIVNHRLTVKEEFKKKENKNSFANFMKESK